MVTMESQLMVSNSRHYSIAVEIILVIIIVIIFT